MNEKNNCSELRKKLFDLEKKSNNFTLPSKDRKSAKKEISDIKRKITEERKK